MRSKEARAGTDHDQDTCRDVARAESMQSEVFTSALGRKANTTIASLHDICCRTVVHLVDDSEFSHRAKDSLGVLVHLVDDSDSSHRAKGSLCAVSGSSIKKGVFIQVRDVTMASSLPQMSSLRSA